MSRRAVAIDLGASSARFAVGELMDGMVTFEVVDQVPHKPRSWDGHEVWDIDFLIDFCRRALKTAHDCGAESLAIDTWGVDHGFVDESGRLLQPPICYRDRSHIDVFENLASHREWLYEETGIQHQPFNTLYQLIARRTQNDRLFGPGVRWLLLPDLLLHMLGAETGYERSIASTTQLTDSHGDWNAAVFERFDLPVPRLPVCSAGPAGKANGVILQRVNGHDTASAVLGMGPLQKSAFASVGTWALVGKLAGFDVSAKSSAENWTNERQTDGMVRRLANVPGFYVLNRLHEELGIQEPFADWLEAAPRTQETFDAFDSRLFAPESMVKAVSECIGKECDAAKLGGIALESLLQAISKRIEMLGVSQIRIAGGGTQSKRLCTEIAGRTQLPVFAGPTEATLLGNLALQFTRGDAAAATELARHSTVLQVFPP